MSHNSVQVETIKTFELLEKLLRWLRSGHTHQRLIQLKKFLDSDGVLNIEQPNDTVTLVEALKLQPLSVRANRIFFQRLRLSEESSLQDLVSSEGISISKLSGLRGCGVGTLMEIDLFFSSFGIKLQVGEEQMAYLYPRM